MKAFFKKHFKKILITCLSIGIIIFSINYYIVKSTEDYVFTDINKLPKVDAIIVLGAKVNNETLSYVLEDRLVAGVNIIYANKFSIQTLGYRLEELLGRHFSDFIREDFKSTVSKLVWQSYLESTWSPSNSPLTLEWEKQRIQVALKAIAANSEFGPAHAIIARKISQLALLDPAFRKESMLEQAEKHVTRAMEVSPDDPDAMFHIAIYYWYRGRFADASSAFGRVLELEPSNFLAQAIQIDGFA